MKKTLLCLAFMATAAGSQATIRYVRTDGSAASAGTGNWGNASNDLQLMINNSLQSDTIFVAAGTYKPNRPVDNITGPIDAANRDNSFYFNKSLVILGGFPATGTPGLNNRNWQTHITTLSGDLDGNDTLDDGNTYSVVVTTETVTNTFLLDGFNIIKGYGSDQGGGGGWRNGGNPVINNSTISGNTAVYGGGWFNRSGNPVINNSTISGNIAMAYGGGWFNIEGNPSISNSIISNNKAYRGGGWENQGGSPSVNNTTISGNFATTYGGGWINYYGSPSLNNTSITGNAANAGGGWYNYLAYATINNTVISGNSAIYGGGWYNGDGLSSITNVTISGNTAKVGGGWLSGDGYSSISNSIIYNNFAVDSFPGIYGTIDAPIAITYSLVQDRPADPIKHNLDGSANPLFVYPQPATQNNPTTAGDYRLNRCSPAINMGNNDSIPAGMTVDPDGNPRTYNNGLVDMGAYEYQGFTDPSDTVIHYLNYGSTYTFNNIVHDTAGYYTYILESEGGCDSTVTLQLIMQYSISGKVHNDLNGMNNGNTINGNGTNAGGLKAVLIDVASNTIAAYTTVDAVGYFLFTQLPQNDYKVIITAANIGNTIPAITLPAGWIHTGEKSGTGTGSDGTADGMLELGTISQNLSVRFGIQQPPTASNTSTDPQVNPGSNASVNLPNSKFAISDASSGAITKLRFTAFPSGTDNLYINGNSYNSATWPGAVEVNTLYLFGNLISPNISIDPTTGAQDVLISYLAIDAAGSASNSATITMPFYAIAIGGIVRNNIDGMNGSPVNTITGAGTNAGGLYALLSNDISNTIIASEEVGSDGTYQFNNIDKGYYSVRLSTSDVAPGTTTPAAGIPQGWMPTAEYNGTGTGTDGYPDSKIYLNLQAANNNNVTFGMQQPPLASTATASSQLNPGGNLTAMIANNIFQTSDVSPGAVTSLYFSGSLPAGVNKLVLNGTVYTATNPLPPAGVHVVANSLGQPNTPIAIDPVNGNVNILLSYKAVDAAGMMSAAAIATIPFHTAAGLMSGSPQSHNVNGNQEATGAETQGLAGQNTINISVYPNPVQDRVLIRITDYSQLKCLSLIDMQGRQLHTLQHDFANGIDMKGLPAGTYLLQVMLHNGDSQRFKIVKE